MESIFLILSGAILVAGVLYWLWSHIQLTQKKVQLLENAVFELRGMLSSSNEGAPAPAPAPASQSGSIEVTRDEDDDNGWNDEAEHKSTPLDAPVLEVADDLQPGGRAIPGSGYPVVTEEDHQSESFRRLFAQQEVTENASVAPSPASAPVVKTSESLDSMPVKELRRLAEQRGIAGATDLRKKEILTALRQQVTSTVSLTLPSSEVESGEVKEINIEKVGAEILE